MNKVPESLGRLRAAKLLRRTDPVAGRIVFGIEHVPDASAADVAELDAMIASMVIEPNP